MFQNIQQEEIQQENNKSEKHSLKDKIRPYFTIQNIMLYIISFAVSSVGCGTSMAPFALAIFAAVCSNCIPAIIVYIMTLLGTAIGLGKSEALIYILTSFIFILATLLIRPKWNKDDRSEKKRLGKYIVGSVLIVQLSKALFGTFLVYDLLASIALSITTYIFYKIFSNSLVTINEFNIKKAFSIEEVVGTSLLLCVAISALRDFSVFEFEVKIILSILIVLVLGWKNGILLGATSGITIGTVLGIIGIGEASLIATFALSGMLAGILSKFGKLGVAIGFILGNAILTYAANGNTLPIIHFKELLIASIGLILVPNKIEIKIEDLVPQTKLLPNGSDYRLEENKETIYKLNTMSETISQMADSYKEVAATIVEEEDIQQKNKEIFIEELKNNIEEQEENILYDELTNYDGEIIKDIFVSLNEKGDITREELLNIFENHNNYIIGFDNATVSLNIEKDIAQVIKIINDSYKISKVNFIWQQKIKENKKTLSNQLDGVSKVIQSMAEDMKVTIQQKFKEEEQEIKRLMEQRNIQIQDMSITQECTGKYIINIYMNNCTEEQMDKCPISNIEKILSKVLGEKIILQQDKCAIRNQSEFCKQIYVSANKYKLQIGVATITKNNSTISGDSYLKTKLEDGKKLIAISDGMGSGENARKSSQIAINMLERLLTSGFDKDTSLSLINSTISTQQQETYATLDIAVFDLYSGNIEFLKNGACPTYIKQGKNVQIIKSLTLPAGILDNVQQVVYDKDIEDGDIILMCTDGILESNTEIVNKELWVKSILEELITDNVQKIADIILQESVDNTGGIAKDDMTIMVAKIIKNN